jgi:PAS domain S-box-containing protein
MMERQRTSGERPSHGPLEHAVASVREYAVFLLDASGRVVTWNAGAELIKGYTRDEIVGRHFSCFYPAEARDAGRPDDELRIAAQLGHVEDEGWRLRKDGSRFWANVVITALFDDRKQVRGFLKITRDLTERRQAEDQLRVSEERFRLLVESVEDYAIFMLDPEGHIVSWNVGAHRIKGYAASEILGQHFSTFYPPEEVAIGKPAALLRTALATGQVEDEGWRVRKDGTRFWANVVITAVHDAEGRLRGFAKVTRDLTQRRYIESLESAGREMSEFLAMLSHELRNPLAPIRNAVALMAAREATDPTTQWARDVIDRQTALLAHLVEDLLDVTRITVGKLQLRLEPTDMAAVIGRAVETIRPVVEARRHHLTVSTPEQPLRVVADLVRLTQVLTNILTNAAKYTPDGGRIALILEHDGTEAVVRVRDSGMGIAPELLPRIFDLFAQGQQGLDRREGGLGVGLALARRLMQLHGGSVTASSEGRGRGSEFVIRLPLATGAPLPSSSDAEADQRIGAGRNVLVVDDNVDSAQGLALLLDLWGFAPRIAHDGPGALAAAATHQPVAVLLDIGLPGMDGYEVARRLRVMPGFDATPIIAVSGYGQEEDQLRARAAGFDQHLVKPVEADRLRSTLQEQLSGRKPAVSPKPASHKS